MKFTVEYLGYKLKVKKGKYGFIGDCLDGFWGGGYESLEFLINNFGEWVDYYIREIELEKSLSRRRTT